MDKDWIIALWEQHLGAELFAKDIDATMATMTGDPYVNHVPTMTGGVGAAELRRFYAHHFISRQPNDFEVVPVSRTVGLWPSEGQGPQPVVDAARGLLLLSGPDLEQALWAVRCHLFDGLEQDRPDIGSEFHSMLVGGVK